jgi:hypothetical protein
MEAAHDRIDGVDSAKDYRQLPPAVRPDETIATVDVDPVPDPEAGRNVDQHLSCPGPEPEPGRKR